MNDLVTLILPDEIKRDGGKILGFLHPRTLKRCQFLVKNDDSKIWELTNVDGLGPYTKCSHTEARSLMFDDGMIHADASIITCTPIKPVFFILHSLYENKSRYMTLDDIHEYMEEHTRKQKIAGCNSFPVRLLMSEEKEIEQCCDTHVEGDETFYKLNNRKLVEYLDIVCQRVVSSLPEEGIKRKNVTNHIVPVDIDAEPPGDVTKLANQKLAIGMISSYLHSDLCDLYYQSKDFNILNEYLEKLQAEREKAAMAQEALQNLNNTNGSNKRKTATKSASTGTNKRSKTSSAAEASASKSKSITSFFKKS